MTTHDKQLEGKINELQQQTEFYVKEFKKALSTFTQKKSNQVVSYFSSSFNISYAEDEESLCLCSYHIWNIGDIPLTNPSITIKLSENSPFSFSGRYIHNLFQKNLMRPNPNDWVRIKIEGEKEVFSFKPLEKTVIEPGEILTFENFQIRWPSNKAYSGSIIGLTYCDQFQDAIPAINPINLSVIKAEQEENT